MNNWPESFEIFDISQPVNEASACFPGDIPFSREITVTHAESGVLNLSAFTMSPHVGTHADAPLHLAGDFNASSQDTVGVLPLSPYIGPCVVVDLSPCTELITWEMLDEKLPDEKLPTVPAFPARVLVRTAKQVRYDVFESAYAAFSPECVVAFAARGGQLLGLDTPSVDPIDSKTLTAHHALIQHDVAWLENLDLTGISPGAYFLLAAPLKLTTLEAAPVRAVLLKAQ